MKMKFENKFFLINMIPVFILFIFALFMFLNITGAFDSLFGDGFLSELIPSSGEEAGPGDGYLFIGGLFGGLGLGLLMMFAMAFFVILPTISAIYMLFWFVIARLCMIGDKSLKKLKFCKIFTCFGNLANVTYILFFVYTLICYLIELNFNGLFCIIPILIFALPFVYTIRTVIKVKEY